MDVISYAKAKQAIEIAEQKADKQELDLALARNKRLFDQLVREKNMMNPNQEVKQSVEGSDVVSLPPNTAEGAGTVSLEGLTNEEGKSVRLPKRIKSVGKNLFDGKLFNGFIDGSNGDFRTNKSYYSSDFFRVEGNTSYFQRAHSGGGIGGVAYYDKNKRFLGGQRHSDGVRFTTLSETYYARTSFLASLYPENNYIMKESGTIRYTPYTESTLHLNSLHELRSLPNGVKDEIRPDGKGGYELVKRVSDTLEPLAEPETIPLSTSGNLTTYPSGTVYFEDVNTDAGVYSDKFTITDDLPIKELDVLTKLEDDTEIDLDISQAVIAEDGLSFTHPDLTEGEIVFVEYYYDSEQPIGNNTVEHYDSRYIIKDETTGDFYKWTVGVDNGEPSIKLEGV